MNILERAIALLAPHACLRCGTEGDLLCSGCAAALPSVPSHCYRCGAVTGTSAVCAACCTYSHLSYVWAATSYQHDAAKALVQALKFNRAIAAADTIARIMVGRLQLDTECIVTHVPTAYSRARQRGYDQAQYIARAVARYAGVRYTPLFGRQGSQRQVGQSRTVRMQQMSTAFYIVNAATTRNATILLIDDVLTTGSTLEAAAAVAHAAGAREVMAAVFAAA